MELPYQTFERVTGQKWPGGRSQEVKALLHIFRIEYPAGSADANISLQACLRLLSFGY